MRFDEKAGKLEEIVKRFDEKAVRLNEIVK